jgi:hypothetical protein
VWLVCVGVESSRGSRGLGHLGALCARLVADAIDSRTPPWDAAHSGMWEASMDSDLAAPPLMLIALGLMSLVLLALVLITTMRRP